MSLRHVTEDGMLLSVVSVLFLPTKKNHPFASTRALGIAHDSARKRQACARLSASAVIGSAAPLPSAGVG